MRPRGSVCSALAGVAALVLLVGCSSGSDNSDLPTREPATAALAPAVTAPPPGRVLPGGPISAVVSDPGTGLLVTLDGTTLTVIDPAAGQPVARTVTLPSRATSLAPGKPGEVLATAADRVLRVDVSTGTLGEVVLEADVRSVHAREDGGLLAGTGDGRVLVVGADGRVSGSVSGLVSADALAVTDGKVTALDRRQTSVSELDLDRGRLALALRAGEGAGTMIGDSRGRVLVTDTAGGELLVYTAGPLVLRQRFPVGSSPYALAYDQRSDTVWVTCTQSNEVVGFDLSTGMPEEVGRFPTVRQPNSAVVDQRTGDLFVGSATGDGLQRIGADDRKRGH